MHREERPLVRYPALTSMAGKFREPFPDEVPRAILTTSISLSFLACLAGCAALLAWMISRFIPANARAFIDFSLVWLSDFKFGVLHYASRCIQSATDRSGIPGIGVHGSLVSVTSFDENERSRIEFSSW